MSVSKELHRHVGFSSIFCVDKRLKQFLVFVIFVLPFQKIIETLATDGNVGWLHFIRYLDESTPIICLFFLVSFMLIKPSAYRIVKIPSTKWIIIFLVSAFISLIWNRVAIAQGIFGIYDALKSILVLYVFANIRYKKDDFLKLLNGLRKIGFIVATFAIISEIAAILFGVGIGYFAIEPKRFGLYRVVSLTGHGSHNYLGLYLILILLLSWPLIKPSIKRISFAMTFFVAIFLTFSRQAWLCLGLILCFYKRKLILPAMALGVFISFWIVTEIQTQDMDNYYRGFTFLESIKILKEHPIVGVGPGMFGSLAASLWNSPYYADWPENLRIFSNNFRTFDSFWPWIWSEYGLLGLSIYLMIGASIFFYLKRIMRFYRERNETVMYNAGRSLRYFIVALGIMGFASGLNCAFVSFTYFAIAGMYISAYRLDKIAIHT